MLVVRYIGLLFKPFFKWWWAAITGIATLLSYFAAPPTGLHLSSLAVALITSAFLTLSFLTISVVLQAYPWFAHASIVKVLSASRGDRVDEKEVFCLESRGDLQPGQVLTLLRNMQDRVILAGFIKVERCMGTRVQCTPLWVAAAHRRDLMQGRLQPHHLQASLIVTEKDLERYHRETEVV